MRLLICGDTVPTDASRAAFAGGDIQTLFGDVLDEFRQADRVLVNLECALTNSEKAIPKFGPNLKGPLESARTLRAAGVTDAGLANNHMYDFGREGLRDTVAALEDAGISWVGAGETDEASRKPLVMRFGAGGEKTCAILAVSEHEYNYALPDAPGATPFDPFDTLLDVQAAKKAYDYVVVTYHGGKEYCRYPSPRLRKACRAMVKLGADAVLCQHSHIVGCYEQYEGGHILYGQGNFHFVGYAGDPSWQIGLLARLTLSETSHGLSVEWLPVEASGAGVSLAQGARKAQILEEMEARNRELRDGRWLSGWRAFCDTVGEMYEKTVYDAADDPQNPRLKERFAHYLDCEAHTDVYRERFQTWHRRGMETK